MASFTMIGEVLVSAIVRSDLLLISLVGALSRGFRAHLSEAYLDESGDEAEDVRRFLGGVWFSLGGILAISLLFLPAARVGISGPIAICGSLMVAYCLALAAVHLVLEGFNRRLPDGRIVVRVVKKPWILWSVFGPLAVGCVWLLGGPN